MEENVTEAEQITRVDNEGPSDCVGDGVGGIDECPGEMYFGYKRITFL